MSATTTPRPTKAQHKRKQQDAQALALVALYEHHTGHISVSRFERGYALLQSLRRLECKASRAATAYCNGEITDEQSDAIDARITRSVAKLFGGTAPDGFFINGEPRGYALKLKGECAVTLRALDINLHTDLGGYAILAPEITGN